MFSDNLRAQIVKGAESVFNTEISVKLHLDCSAQTQTRHLLYLPEPQDTGS